MAYRISFNPEDLPHDIEALVEETLEWFNGEPLRTEEFIDRLCDSHATDWDIEDYNSPASRTIMKIARRIRKESS